MIVSEKNKYVYFDNPKTGTVSTELFLLEIDPSTIKREFTIEGKPMHFVDHTIVSVVKEKLGSKYDEYTSFSIVREPFSKLVSSYFFYKNGQPIAEGNNNPWPARLRMAFARLTPLWLWALLYPYRSNKFHLTDNKGHLLVNYVGFFENLSENVNEVLQNIGVNVPEGRKLPHKNKSSHKSPNEYFKNPIIRKLISYKLRDDIKFYHSMWNEGKVYYNNK